jgi:OmpA-OmpF porin, OOP family
MKTKVAVAFGLGLIATLLVGCAAQQPVSPYVFAPEKVQAYGHELKAPNFLVIMDASSSMGERYTDRSKFTLAKEVVDRLNQTLPDLAMTGGLRTFGHGSCIAKERTVLLSDMGPHSQQALAGGLEKAVCAGGNSPLDEALMAAVDDLKATAGNIALIVVTDGKKMAPTTVPAAEALKAEFGDRICFFPVLVGDDTGGKVLADQLAEVGGCGFAVNADDIMAPAAMSGFVTKIFIGDALDSDGDGVPDHLDKCPDTPAGVVVDADGCPLDSDGDGVPDHLDKCPGTPTGAKVDVDGCWILGSFLFDFDKAIVRADAVPELIAVADVLRKNPDLQIIANGHTDNIGTAEYNQGLSERRARAVMQFLVGEGIAADRMQTVGHGLNAPVADNGTPAGRQQNRRVELTPIK